MCSVRFPTIHLQLQWQRRHVYVLLLPGKASPQRLRLALPPCGRTRRTGGQHWKTSQLPVELLDTVRHNLTADLDKQRTSATKLIDAARRKIEKIERDRVVWATKSADGVIPDDIGRAKQNELTQQLVEPNTNWPCSNKPPKTSPPSPCALDLIRDCGLAYAAAEPMVRRDWNQTFFADRRRRRPGHQVHAQTTLRHLDGPESHRPLRAANSDPRHPDTKKDPRRGPSEIS